MIWRTAILVGCLALGSTLGACATEEATSPSSYALGRGVVSYDELRRASDKCRADGGTIQAKQDGGDPAQLSNYTCVISKGKQRQ